MDDFQTLATGQYLDSNIIQIYLNLLEKRSHMEEKPKSDIERRKTFIVDLQVMKTTENFAWDLINSEFDRTQKAEKWLEGENFVINNDLILFPAHTGDNMAGHWSLVYVEKNRKKLDIYHLDSLDGMANGGRNMILAGKFLMWYLNIRNENKGEDKDFEIEEIFNGQQVPQQGTSPDCGIFMLAFCEYLTRSNEALRSFDFGQSDMRRIRLQIGVKILQNDEKKFSALYISKEIRLEDALFLQRKRISDGTDVTEEQLQNTFTNVISENTDNIMTNAFMNNESNDQINDEEEEEESNGSDENNEEEINISNLASYAQDEELIMNFDEERTETKIKTWMIKEKLYIKEQRKNTDIKLYINWCKQMTRVFFNIKEHFFQEEVKKIFNNEENVMEKIYKSLIELFIQGKRDKRTNRPQKIINEYTTQLQTEKDKRKKIIYFLLSFIRGMVIIKEEKYYGSLIIYGADNSSTPLKISNDMTTSYLLQFILAKIFLQNESGVFTARDIHYLMNKVVKGDMKKLAPIFTNSMLKFSYLIGMTWEELNIIPDGTVHLYGSFEIENEKGEKMNIPEYNTEVDGNWIRGNFKINMKGEIPFLLICEKHAFINLLLQDNFFRKYPNAILLNTMGKPSYLVARFLKKFQMEFPAKPIICLFDGDIGGYEIYTSLKYGQQTVRKMYNNKYFRNIFNEHHKAAFGENVIDSMIWAGLKLHQLDANTKEILKNYMTDVNEDFLNRIKEKIIQSKLADTCWKDARELIDEYNWVLINAKILNLNHLPREDDWHLKFIYNLINANI